MNGKFMNRTLGATALLAVLLGSAACGTETVSETDPGTQSAAHPKVHKAGGIGTTADSAERRAAAEKARQDRASADRWARGTNVENKLKSAGHPGQP
jgi:hypothetical protein